MFEICLFMLWSISSNHAFPSWLCIFASAALFRFAVFPRGLQLHWWFLALRCMEFSGCVPWNATVFRHILVFVGFVWYAFGLLYFALTIESVFTCIYYCIFDILLSWPIVIYAVYIPIITTGLMYTLSRFRMFSGASCLLLKLGICGFREPW